MGATEFMKNPFMHTTPLFPSSFEQEHAALKAQLTLSLHQQDNDDACQLFRNIIKHYHAHSRRPFPWRDHINPYHVVVSEIMLQQTQTYRVEPKFTAFVATFPDFATLAQAPTHEVIRMWKGLGYNRRALALQKIAQAVVSQHDGILPNQPAILETFPGIGKATARSITTFAFNKPTVFIETNIRSVFIYFFFKHTLDITDKALEPLIEKTVDHDNPREWYYALMDYGVMLKKTVGNLCRLSAHYSKQSKFEGSDRQVRGMILQVLLDQPGIGRDGLVLALAKEEERAIKILQDLIKEGFIRQQANCFWLK